MLGGSKDRIFMKWIESPENRRFSKVNLLGEGGCAYTFQAYDAQPGQNVVIKIPKKGDIIDEGFKAALLCPHDHIVQVYDIFRYDDDKRALLMEFIEGGDLRRHLRRLRGNIETAVKITIHICKALKQAHEHVEPIVHCDVKPENILLSFPKATFSSKAAIAKLTDFGIARGVNTRIAEVFGSLPYMAPEQIEKIKDFEHRKKVDAIKPDVRWDIYAATVVLYEMLEGKPPFEGKTEDLIQKITNDSPKMFRDDIPNGLKRIVYRGLEKDPADRHKTVSDMLCDLEVFQCVNTQIVRVTEEIEKKYPNHPPAYLKLSEMYTDESIENLRYLRTELESDYSDASTTFRLALLHGASNDYDEAEAAIQKTQQLDLEKPTHPLKRAHPFIERFAVPEADETPSGEVDADDGDDDDTGLETEPIDSEQRKGDDDTDKNPEQVDSNQKEDKDYSNQINKVKDLILREGEVGGAKEVADEILEACTDPEIYLRLGQLFANAGVFDSAIGLFERGIERCGNHAELYARLGETLDAFGHFSRAREAIKKAIEHGCNEPKLKNLLQDLENS